MLGRGVMRRIEPSWHAERKDMRRIEPSWHAGRDMRRIEPFLACREEA